MFFQGPLSIDLKWQTRHYIAEHTIFILLSNMNEVFWTVVGASPNPDLQIQYSIQFVFARNEVYIFKIKL